MKTLFITLALLAACCTALVHSEFRNFTTTEIEDNWHVQSLIPKGLKRILKTNEIANQFNTTDFILDKINFVSQKEFNNGYIYKINVDFINSAGEIAHTQFIGTFNIKSKKFSIFTETYTVEYPQMDFEEEFKPSPINGTHSTGIYKNLRNYVQENFNSTVTENRLRGYLFGNGTMYNSTYLPQDYNMSSTYDVPQNYSSNSYNNTWRNKTYSEGYRNHSSDSYNNTWINKTYSEYNGSNNTANWTNTTYLSSNKTAGTNITEVVYNSLNMLVDMFNSTDLDIEEIELDLEPLIGTVFEFVSKRLGESFGIDLEKIMAEFVDFETSNETMPTIPKKHKSVFA